MFHECFLLSNILQMHTLGSRDHSLKKSQSFFKEYVNNFPKSR